MRFDKSLLVALIVATGLVVGCGNFAGGPGSTDQTILFAGDAGLACVAIPEKDKPKAKAAVACADALFSSDTIDADQVAACAESAGVPAQYKAIVVLVVDRIKARTGGAAFPKDSVGGEAVKAFLRVCSVALG